MIVDGKKIAEEIFAELAVAFAALPAPARLGLLYSQPDFATKKFIAIKEKRAAQLGISIVTHELPVGATTQDALAALDELANTTDAVVVQLPLRSNTESVEGNEHSSLSAATLGGILREGGVQFVGISTQFPVALIDQDAVLAAIPSTHDIDALTEGALVLSPVVVAMAEILRRSNVLLQNKKVAVIGQGRLVGAPATAWAKAAGAQVATAIEGDDMSAITRDADIVILGAGIPGLLQPSMIKKGVVILDAGTSESSGKLAGDADPACAEVASIFTPVPGGIGPIAVATLFKNLLTMLTPRG